MNNFFSKLSLYDQVGYLLVGAIGLMLITLDIYIVYGYLPPALDVQNIIIYLIAAYFVGHVLQGLSNLFIVENKNNFSDFEKDVLLRVKNYFNLIKASDEQTYSLCNMFCSTKDPSGQIQSFNATYSLYRGWLVSFLLESIVSGVYLLFKVRKEILLVFLLSLILTFIFYKRRKRFFKYCKEKTLQNFIIITKN